MALNLEFLQTLLGFPGDSVIKSPPVKPETQFPFVGWRKSTHSRILAWEIPRIEEPDGLQSTGSQKSWKHYLATKQQQTLL